MVDLTEIPEDDLLARVIWGEARSESILGQVAVACAALNRLARPVLYGKTLRDVLLRPKAFSCLNHNDPNRNPILRLNPHPKYITIAQLAIAGLLEDPTGGATLYHRDDITPEDWDMSLVQLKITIGRHIFYTEA